MLVPQKLMLILLRKNLSQKNFKYCSVWSLKFPQLLRAYTLGFLQVLHRLFLLRKQSLGTWGSGGATSLSSEKCHIFKLENPIKLLLSSSFLEMGKQIKKDLPKSPGIIWINLSLWGPVQCSCPCLLCSTTLIQPEVILQTLQLNKVSQDQPAELKVE